MSQTDYKCNIVMQLPQTGISARTMILDLLATDADATYSAAQLVRAGAAFGLESTGIRSAITRLKADQRLRQVERGRYAIGPRGEPLQHRVLGWRSMLERRRAWNGEWLLAIATPQERADRTVWRHLLRALELEGFAPAETNVWTRPDNLAGGAAGVRARLSELAEAPSLLLVEAHGLDEPRRSRFAALWDCGALMREHEQLLAALERSRERGIVDSAVAAMAAETLTLGRLAIRRIVRAPLLPDELCPNQGLIRLIDAMVHYDEYGKAVWRRFLAGSAASGGIG